MNALLKLARVIDAISEFIGKSAIWLVLVVVLVSAANAVMRYTIDYSSNAYLEIQWYLFGLIFLSCAGYTLLRDEHVRIDVLYAKFSRRTQIKIDIFGILFFLLPMVVGVVVLSWLVFVDAFESGEMSNNAGGLIVWPARLMFPVGFFLLAMQAVSELIKRIGFLKGLCPDPVDKSKQMTPEEELVREIKSQKGEA